MSLTLIEHSCKALIGEKGLEYKFIKNAYKSKIQCLTTMASFIYQPG